MGSMDFLRFTFIEPLPILPIYCDGMAGIEAIEGQMHFAFYVNQHVPGKRIIEHIVTARLIMPAAGVVLLMPRVFAALPVTLAGPRLAVGH